MASREIFTQREPKERNQETYSGRHQPYLRRLLNHETRTKPPANKETENAAKDKKHNMSEVNIHRQMKHHIKADKNFHWTKQKCI